MAKKKSVNRTEGITPIGEVVSAEEARDVLAVDENAILNRKLGEIAELLFFFDNMEQTEKSVRIVRALELYESLGPADGVESMLASQMVGTHVAALDCLRRAAINSQSFDGRDLNLKHAQKLMALYAKQVATLDKHRGKGQQKVTVEYVNVEPGGQAIVGNVEAGRTGGSAMEKNHDQSTNQGSAAGDKREEKFDAIEHNPSVSMPKAKSRRKAPGKRP